jgi:hypothetical protein
MYGLALARALQLDKAKEQLSQLATSADAADFPEAMFELGQICLAQKNPDAAGLWFERYLDAMKAAGRDAEAGVAAAREHLRKLRGTRDG